MVYVEITSIPALFGSVRLVAKLSDQAAAYDQRIKLSSVNAESAEDRALQLQHGGSWQ